MNNTIRLAIYFAFTAFLVLLVLLSQQARLRADAERLYQLDAGGQ